MKIRVVKILFIIFIFFLSTNLNPQSLTWLGTLGGDESVAFAVSNDGGVVVGRSKNYKDEDRAFIWKPGTGMQYLSGASNIIGWAKAVSADGNVIVGTTQDDIGIRKAFKWTQATSLQYLTPLGGTPFNESEANDITADGSKIVGKIRKLSDEVRGFVWDETNGMKEVPAFFYRGDISIVNAISSIYDNLVGWSSDTVNNFDQVPVNWRKDNYFFIIDAFQTPYGSGNGVAEEISENSHYAVGSVLINGYMHGLRWHLDDYGYWSTEVDIGLLPGITNPSAICYALDVTNDGEIVGFTTGSSPDGIVAFLWERISPTLDIMRDLNVLYSNLINQSGYLLQATAISPDGRYIVGKGYRQSLFRYEAYLLDRGISTEVEELNEQLPLDFVLQQNYPNPFNPSTKIRYSIPRSTEYYSVPQNVTLKVYDILGNEVATLVNEVKPAGFYEVEFSAESFGNASQLSSGVYFYKLQAGSFVETKKMLLIK